MGTRALPELPPGYAAPVRRSGPGPVRGLPERAAEPAPGAGRLGSGGAGAVGHAHLWVLLDGTPAHAAPGRLAADEDGRLACHLCGRWFAHLGAHLRGHGWTAAQYREAAGLPLHVPLCSADVSGQIAARQKANWDRDPEAGNRFAPGRELARSGELNRLATAAAKIRQDSGRAPGTVLAARAAHLAAGRAAQAGQRDRRLAAVVAGSGAGSLHELLRARYGAGASLGQLAKLTGLGRVRLRAELAAAGAVIRASGDNLPASRHARGTANDALAGARVGAGDIRAWLLAQRQAGATLRELAQRTGRSIPWVRSRLAGPPAVTALTPRGPSRAAAADVGENAG
jgi:hypothetical protein